MEASIHKVLCIEDNQDTCVLVSILLDAEGFGVILAHTQAEGFALLEREQISLIIIDVKLPDGSGIDFIRRIREAGVHTPVLIHSGVAFKKVIDEAREAGADDYLVKPLGWEKLTATVSRLCAKAGREMAHY